MPTDTEERKPGLPTAANTLTTQGFRGPGYGQSYPKHYPRQAGMPELSQGRSLGQPLSIRQVAAMLGCSPWTVRQRSIPAGLPHFRSGPNGKIVFFHDQVVTWILEQQQKGGKW